eukprot:15459141-Alexandrium_andersonii.AAC.1
MAGGVVAPPASGTHPVLPAALHTAAGPSELGHEVAEAPAGGNRPGRPAPAPRAARGRLVPHAR